MQDNQEFVRDYRAKGEIIEWGDCKLTQEEIDEVISPFISNKSKMPNQEIYLSSKELFTGTTLICNEKEL